MSSPVTCGGELARCATVASTCWPHSAGGVKVLTPWGIELGLSSIEPNDAGDELAGCQGFARGLLIASGDRTEPLKLRVEVLDQMARAIELSVIVAWATTGWLAAGSPPFCQPQPSA